MRLALRHLREFKELFWWENLLTLRKKGRWQFSAFFMVLDVMTCTLCSETGVDRHTRKADSQSASPAPLSRATWGSVSGAQDAPQLRLGPSSIRALGRSCPPSRNPCCLFRDPMALSASASGNQSLCHCVLPSFCFRFKK